MERASGDANNMRPLSWGGGGGGGGGVTYGKDPKYFLQAMIRSELLYAPVTHSELQV